MLTGFILTNTRCLANILGVSAGKITILLDRYIKSCSSFINWELIDVGGCDCYNELDLNDWHTYVSILNDNRCGLGLEQKGVYNTPLFIIGGDDVIPMPKMLFKEFDEKEMSVDMLYCFGECVENNLEEIVNNVPRFAVGRLPIAKVPTDSERFTITHLSDYLDNSVSLSLNVIQSRGTLVTTLESCLEESKNMMSDIPSVDISPTNVTVVDDIVSCPPLDTSIQEMYDGYVHELRKADVWVSTLHGNQINPNFVGDLCYSSENPNSVYYPPAIQASMLEQVHPYIFNTNACYGGRCTTVQLLNSMLLSALVNGTMLYYGASVSAYGCNGRLGCAMALMRLYNVYQHQGMPAGMALLKAKQDYYHAYHGIDSDEKAMFTILEFNLFGCPILSMQPQLDMLYKPELPQKTMKKSRVAYRPKTAVPLINRQHKSMDISVQIKYSTDRKLASVYQKIESEVYHYYRTDNVELEQVFRLTQDGIQVGYRFVYKRSIGDMEMIYILECDNDGNITTAISTL